MEEQVREGNGGLVIKGILFAIRRNLILIITVIILCTGCAIGYSFIKASNYTATEEVIYLAADEEGKYNGTAMGVNIMRSYFNTVVDFCDEGVVIERANFYYVQYVNRVITSEPDLTVDVFIQGLKVADPYDETNLNIVEEKYIVKSGVSISVAVETDEQDQFAFSISYTDPDKEEAQKKARIYVEAFKRELKTTRGLSGGKYFEGIEVDIISLGSSGVVSDVSRPRFAILGFIVGVMLASVLVYLISIADTSVKSKEELEELTGTKLITYIENEGGNSDGK